MTDRHRFGLDLDGVVYQWDKTARYMLRTMKGYPKDGPLGRESTGWNSIQEHVSKEDWNWLWNTGVRLGLFRYGHLYSGAIEGIRALADLGDVVVITHRPRSAVQDTLDWLSYLKLPFTEVHLLTNGEAKSNIKCCLYVDDKPENIIDFYKNTNGIPFIWRRGWNESWIKERVAENTLQPFLIAEKWEDVVDYARSFRR